MPVDLRRLCLSFIGIAVSVLSAYAAAGDPGTVDFNKDVRPILSDKCYTCHGPDPAKRMSKLRLDTEEGAFQDLGGRFAIMRKEPSRSEIIRRVSSEKPGLRMPPAHTGPALSQREIGLLTRWVEQGAPWQKHWSFIPPQRSDVPAGTNGIDFFVQERLAKESLQPAPEASRETLIRRVSLDLTGLPPTPAEVDAFLADSSPAAYEKLVDRLLASPRYGERMAIRWLDAARYADTNGYQTDGERHMWRWRDWVIEAFNRNMPFDQFTVEQLAGDLLPEPTLEQKIATGFNRNHRGNSEGGIVPEEYAVEYVVDRVDTTATVWLGLTLGCARCHDHKYDPLTQKEFYRTFAYFNNVPERGRAIKYGNSAPYIPAPTKDQQAKLAELDRVLNGAESKFVQLQSALAKAQPAWESTLGKAAPLDWAPSEGLLSSWPTTTELDGKNEVEAGNAGDFGFYDKFSISAWIRPAFLNGAIVSHMLDKPEGKGYGLHMRDGKIHFNIVSRWLDDSIRVETEESLPLGHWRHIAMAYDGSRLATGVQIYIDGKPAKMRIILDELNNDPFGDGDKVKFRIGGGAGPEDRFRGAIKGVRLYGRELTEEESQVLSVADPLNAIAARPAEKRSSAESAKLRLAFLNAHAPAEILESWRTLKAQRDAKATMIASFPTVMVMEDSEKPRDTFLLLRGAYDRPGEKVSPGVPQALHPFPADLPQDRLGFARWLVDPANPLTARVTVNRYWQMYFGTGLVKTTEDFGAQGEWPSHPQLLDWLATEFVRLKWDVKAMQKLIVMSAAYRQESRVTPELLEKDPDNRLLARGPRLRLPAEALRDQALAASGLLVEQLGGPSVKPYQPAGLWKELAGGSDYKADHGAGLYRRSLYTFWKRTSAPPTMMTFDSAGRETCTVRESRTNTPLQALSLMNDVTYLEAARVLAERTLASAPTPEKRILDMFRRVTARKPKGRELEILTASFHHYLDRQRSDPSAAKKFLSVGESPLPAEVDTGELAAYTAVASLILNLDEAITKE